MLVDYPEPFERFQEWYALAQAQELNDPNAMALASVDPEGRPSVRMVLLKDFDERGFVFYTNLQSRKGTDIQAHPAVALCLHWKSIRKQVRIEGDAHLVTPAEADAYYASRSRGSRIGAWASEQSRPLDRYQTLVDRAAEFEAKYPGEEIPRPPHWLGFRVVPQRIELWEDGAFRLHHRDLYVRSGTGWDKGHLYP